MSREFAIPEIPVCAPPTFGPEMVTAFPAWETVMLLPPASVTVPEESGASAPAVFPESVSWCCGMERKSVTTCTP